MHAPGSVKKKAGAKTPLNLRGLEKKTKSVEPLLLFLVVSPGLEDLAYQELLEVSAFLQLQGGLLPPQKIRILAGEGLELEVLSKEWFVLNDFLKIPSRILWRLTEFRAPSIPELKRRLLRFFNSQEILFRSVQVSARACAVSNEKKIRTLLSECQEELRGKIKNSKAFDLWLRGYKDVFTISQDLSGEHLHFRGYRVAQGAAPIRENFAAAIATYFLSGLSLKELQNAVFLDPFCGSGTLLFEIATLYLPVPSFSRRSYSYKELDGDFLQKLETSLQFSQVTFWQKYLVGKLWLGADVDAAAIECSKKNLATLPLLHNRCYFMVKDQRNLNRQEVLSMLPESGEMESSWEAGHGGGAYSADQPDRLKDSSFPDHELYMIANLPYGDRVKLQGAGREQVTKGVKENINLNQNVKINIHGSEVFSEGEFASSFVSGGGQLTAMVLNLLREFRPMRCGLLMSERQYEYLKKSLVVPSSAFEKLGYKVNGPKSSGGGLLRFSNNSIPVVFVLFIRN